LRADSSFDEFPLGDYVTIMSLYPDYPLDERDLEPTPFPQFHRWLNAAESAALPEFNAMTLSTASIDGKPSSRVVLLRGHDERGFVFFTNYLSRKGGELAANPFASLLFFWAPFQRQIRIEGTVSQVSPTESDAYFASRPKGHRLGALVSPQSQTIPGREFLASRMEELVRKYQDTEEVPRPEHWGGYRVAPTAIEFWQGRENRLHDRIRYSKLGDGQWIKQRLAP
jgi:pyridoxamine 5'-phosphate oxidase